MRKILTVFLLMLFLTGFLYPLLILGIADMLFPNQATGSFVEKKGGSKLIGQNFVQDRYFWPRPSSTDYNPLPSGGSNLGPTSLELKHKIEERQKRLASTPPSQLLYASASGLDPHISPESAYFQVDRIAKARGVSKEKIEQLVEKSVTPKQFLFLGEPVVNVLELNLLLDKKEL